MYQRALQPADAARHLHRLVHGALDESAAPAPEEPELPVGPEPAVADPLAPEDVAAGSAIAVVRPALG